MRLDAFQLGFSIAPNKARESAHGCGLQPRAHWARAHNLIDFNRLPKTLHIDQANWLDLHIALSEAKSVRRHHDRSWRRHMLHPRSQMGCLPDRGVVHLEIAADGSHHDLSGVQPDSYLDGNSLGPSYSLSIFLH